MGDDKDPLALKLNRVAARLGLPKIGEFASTDAQMHDLIASILDELTKPEPGNDKLEGGDVP